MPKLKLSTYQKNILSLIEKNGGEYYGIANLRSLLALQKLGLIVSGSGYMNVAGGAIEMVVWRLTDKGKNAIGV